MPKSTNKWKNGVQLHFGFGFPSSGIRMTPFKRHPGVLSVRTSDLLYRLCQAGEQLTEISYEVCVKPVVTPGARLRYK